MASPLQVGNAAQQRVSRTPQTTAPPAGGPFNRQTRRSRLFGFTSSANDFGETISMPLKPVPGYGEYLDVTVTVANGAAGKAVVAAAADAPYSILHQVQITDAFGNPIIVVGGWELAALCVYGGQAGFWQPLGPSPYSPVPDANGNFTFHLIIPFELFAGFCSIPMANASAVPNLRITLGTSAEVYTTPPDTLSDIDVTIEQAYYAVGLTTPNAEPPDNGASHQWFTQPSTPQIGSAGVVNNQLPPLGGWLTTLLLIGRDSLGVRSNNVLFSGNDTQTSLWIDNVPEFEEQAGTHRAWQRTFFNVPAVGDVGSNFLTGVFAYSWRDAVGTFGPIDAVDTGDAWVETNPGTIIQFKSQSGVFANAPGTITVVSGRVYTPTGVPYTHLGT